mmetsp:Transcript_103241/g.262132  ORF Transcript_103241/g.262132 Transcript_103241/m.262132 type:complete len:242 (+) Transcript_103241:541-1266(+)
MGPPSLSSLQDLQANQDLGSHRGRLARSADCAVQHRGCVDGQVFLELSEWPALHAMLVESSGKAQSRRQHRRRPDLRCREQLMVGPAVRCGSEAGLPSAQYLGHELQLGAGDVANCAGPHRAPELHHRCKLIRVDARCYPAGLEPQRHDLPNGLGCTACLPPECACQWLRNVRRFRHGACQLHRSRPDAAHLHRGALQHHGRRPTGRALDARDPGDASHALVAAAVLLQMGSSGFRAMRNR